VNASGAGKERTSRKTDLLHTGLGKNARTEKLAGKRTLEAGGRKTIEERAIEVEQRKGRGTRRGL